MKTNQLNKVKFVKESFN